MKGIRLGFQVNISGMMGNGLGLAEGLPAGWSGWKGSGVIRDFFAPHYSPDPLSEEFPFR